MTNNCQNCNHRVDGELNFYFDKKWRPTVGAYPSKCALTGDKIKRTNVKKCDKYESEVKDE